MHDSVRRSLCSQREGQINLARETEAKVVSNSLIVNNQPSSVLRVSSLPAEKPMVEPQYCRRVKSLPKLNAELHQYAYGTTIGGHELRDDAPEWGQDLRLPCSRANRDNEGNTNSQGERSQQEISETSSSVAARISYRFRKEIAQTRPTGIHRTP